MRIAVGVDPYEWPLDEFCDAFLVWAKDNVMQAHPKTGAAKWREIERDLWAGVEKPPQARRQAFQEARSALSQLGAIAQR